MWELIVSVPDHCLSFYFTAPKKRGPARSFEFHINEFGGK